jgi:hypothetical protein
MVHLRVYGWAFAVLADAIPGAVMVLIQFLKIPHSKNINSIKPN